MTPEIWMQILFYSYLAFSFITAVLAFVFAYKWFMLERKDFLFFIDRSNRWHVIFDKTIGKEQITYDGKVYILQKDVPLNRFGRGLYIFSVNRPMPMNLSYTKAEWLTGENLMSIMNNEIVKKLIELSDKFKDMLLIIGAICGVIAGIASVVNLLIATGVIKP